MIWAVLILLFTAYSIGVFFVPWWIVLGALGAIQIILMLVLRVNVKKAIISLVYFLPFVVITAGFHLLFGDTHSALIMSARLGLVWHATVIFSQKVPILKFAHGLKILLYPLKIFRINPRDIAVMIAIAVTFIPIIAAEFKQIRGAMNAKGRKRGVLIVLKVFMYKILYRAGQLSLTLEAKGYI